MLVYFFSYYFSYKFIFILNAKICSRYIAQCIYFGSRLHECELTENILHVIVEFVLSKCCFFFKALDSCLLVFTQQGNILYVSESITSLLGHLPVSTYHLTIDAKFSMKVFRVFIKNKLRLVLTVMLRW